jgi:hypothetical protein
MNQEISLLAKFQKINVLTPILVCLFLFLLGVFQPTPGRGEWVTLFLFIPDWSIKVDQTGYEIGTSSDPEKLGTFVIFRWKPYPIEDNKNVRLVMKPVIDGVNRYNTDGVWVVAETKESKVWINSRNHEIGHFNKQDTHTKMPSEVNFLFQSLKKPKSSGMYFFIRLGIICMIISLINLWRNHRSVKISSQSCRKKFRSIFPL